MEKSKSLTDVLERIRARIGENILEVGEFRGQTFVVLKDKNYIKDLIKLLREEGFNHLQTLTAVDYSSLNKPKRFEAVYQLYSISHKLSLRIRVPLEDGEGIESIVEDFPSANFFEREVYDLFGISFIGHPNLKRILLPETWEGHPLRKDYPLEPEEKPQEFKSLVELKERLARHDIK
ncbi:MAG: NADH-quinone oxidoreductase subunit C [Caldimicrobium sp.]|nr:NADH-quinone oxidoreductase subunit C [Caldimicrobium sp.]MCX7873402.1 NADH-quinone oxidoreductase subunit C [Caldimicrobium sp.]MDW8094380.1 NADH-quinone oxidoreductase subunit C [Caldimicrobium sp.]